MGMFLDVLKQQKKGEVIVATEEDKILDAFTSGGLFQSTLAEQESQQDFVDDATTGPVLKESGKSIIRGVLNTAKGFMGSYDLSDDELRDLQKMGYGDAFGEPGAPKDLPGRLVDEALASEYISVNQAVLKDMSFVDQVIMAAPNVGIAAAISIATRKPKLGAAYMGIQIMGDQIESLTNQGVNLRRATKMGFLNAAMQYPLESFGLSKMTKFWRLKTAIAKRAIALGLVTTAEGGTEALQVIPERITDILGRDVSKSTLEAIWETMGNVETYKQMGLEGSIGAIFGFAIGGGGIVKNMTLDKAAELIVEKDLKTAPTVEEAALADEATTDLSAHEEKRLERKKAKAKARKEKADAKPKTEKPKPTKVEKQEKPETIKETVKEATELEKAEQAAQDWLKSEKERIKNKEPATKRDPYDEPKFRKDKDISEKKTVESVQKDFDKKHTGLVVDAIGEEGTTLPEGTVQVTVPEVNNTTITVPDSVTKTELDKIIDDKKQEFNKSRKDTRPEVVPGKVPAQPPKGSSGKILPDTKGEILDVSKLPDQTGKQDDPMAEARKRLGVEAPPKATPALTSIETVQVRNKKTGEVKDVAKHSKITGRKDSSDKVRQEFRDAHAKARKDYDMDEWDVGYSGKEGFVPVEQVTLEKIGDLKTIQDPEGATGKKRGQAGAKAGATALRKDLIEERILRVRKLGRKSMSKKKQAALKVRINKIKRAAHRMSKGSEFDKDDLIQEASIAAEEFLRLTKKQQEAKLGVYETGAKKGQVKPWSPSFALKNALKDMGGRGFGGASRETIRKHGAPKVQQAQDDKVAGGQELEQADASTMTAPAEEVRAVATTETLSKLRDMDGGIGTEQEQIEQATKLINIEYDVTDPQKALDEINDRILEVTGTELTIMQQVRKMVTGTIVQNKSIDTAKIEDPVERKAALNELKKMRIADEAATEAAIDAELADQSEFIARKETSGAALTITNERETRGGGLLTKEMEPKKLSGGINVPLPGGSAPAAKAFDDSKTEIVNNRNNRPWTSMNAAQAELHKRKNKDRTKYRYATVKGIDWKNYKKPRGKIKGAFTKFVIEVKQPLTSRIVPDDLAVGKEILVTRPDVKKIAPKRDIKSTLLEGREKESVGREKFSKRASDTDKVILAQDELRRIKHKKDMKKKLPPVRPKFVSKPESKNVATGATLALQKAARARQKIAEDIGLKRDQREARVAARVERAEALAKQQDTVHKKKKKVINTLKKGSATSLLNVIRNQKGGIDVRVPGSDSVLSLPKKIGGVWTQMVDQAGDKIRNQINRASQTSSALDTVLTAFVTKHGIDPTFLQLEKDKKQSNHTMNVHATRISKAIERIDAVFDATLTTRKSGLTGKALKASERRAEVGRKAKEKRLLQIAEGSVTTFSDKTVALRLAIKEFQVMEQELRDRGMLQDHQFRSLNKAERAAGLDRVHEIETKIIKNEKSDAKKSLIGKRNKKLAKERRDLLARLQIHYKNSGVNYVRHIKDQIEQNNRYMKRFTLDAMSNKWSKRRQNWRTSVDRETGIVTVKRVKNKKGLLSVSNMVMKGLTQEAHDLHLFDLYSNIAKSDEEFKVGDPKNVRPWATNNPEDFAGGKKHYVQMPNNKHFGPLANMYVEKHIYADMKSTIEDLSSFKREVRKAFRNWKGFKTVWNPATQVRNFVSNIALAHVVGDVNFFKPQTYKMWQQAFKDFAAVNKGLIPTSQYGQEIVEQTTIHENTFSQAELGEGDYITKLSEIIAEASPYAGITKVALAAGKSGPLAYQMMEITMKSVVYSNARANGKTIEDSAALAEKALFNYNEVPPGIKWARNYYSPFVTFTFKAVPALTKAVARKPWKLLPYYGMVYGAQMLTELMLGESEEEQEMKRRRLPDYMDRNMLPGMPSHVRIPIRTKDGDDKYLDLSFVLPWGDFSNMGEGALSWLPQMLVPNNPILTLTAAALTEVDVFSRRRITLDTDSGGEKIWKLFVKVANESSPGIVSPQKMDKMLGAFYGDKNLRGHTKYSVADAVLDWALGVKIRNIDYMEQSMWRAVDIQMKAKEIKSVYKKEYNDIMMRKAGRYEGSQKEALQNSMLRFQEKMDGIVDEYNHTFQQENDNNE